MADVLRGLAVMGIILLHSIEHFNFYSFPEKVPFEWMNFTDQAIWTTVMDRVIQQEIAGVGETGIAVCEVCGLYRS